MEQMGRKNEYTIWQLVCTFKLKSYDLEQPGTEIKYKSDVKCSDSKQVKTIQILYVSLKGRQNCVLFFVFFLFVCFNYKTNKNIFCFSPGNIQALCPHVIKFNNGVLS